MQKIIYIPRLVVAVTLALILSTTNKGYSQASIGGPTCVLAGTQYSYTLYAYYSGTANFSYTISGGTLSTGGTSGTHSGPGSVGILVTWTTNGSITLNSPAGYAVLTSTITPAFSPGSFTSGQTQTINYGTTPATLNCSAPAGGTCTTPNDVYQWQESPDNINFMNLNGATAQNLTFSSGATQTMYYKRFSTETTGSNSGYTPVASVVLNPPNPILPVNGGSVTPGVQNINYNTIPASLSSVSVTNGTYSYKYQWQSSPDNSTWSNIPCAVMTYIPGMLTSTTYYRVAVTSNGVTAYSNSAVVNVYPKLNAGLITPASINIASGGNPGGLDCSQATGGNNAYVYQWQSSTDGINFPTNIGGATSLSYSPGFLSANSWYRLMVTSNGVTAYSNVASVAIVTGSPDISFVRTRDILKPGVPDSTTAAALTNRYDVSQTTQYVDGLGRPMQTVAMQQTPKMNDMVSFIQYDGFGRETNKFLPYAASTNDGNYKNTAVADQYSFNSGQFPGEQYYYGQVNCEPSPLNRVVSAMSPGLSWNGSGRGVTKQYQVSTASDSVRIWTITPGIGSIPSSTSIYVPYMLYKNVTTDESGHQVIEYKDMDEQTVLKKVQSAPSPGSAHVGWLCTYYVYDDMRNLRFVISPRAVELINVTGTWTISQAIANELCFRYEYDYRRRVIIKKVPGAGEVHMVYDTRNRLVMSQDSNMRAQQQWLVSVYDGLNRPDSTGTITDPTNYNNQPYHETQAMLGGEYPNWASYTNQLLTKTFYDDYSGISPASGLPAVMATNKTSNGNYFITSYGTGPVYAVALTAHPITRGMVTGTVSDVITTSPSSQFLYTENFYDDRGRLIQTRSTNYSNGIDTLTTQYNFSGKILRSLLGQQNATNQGQVHQVLTKNNYDAAFRLTSIYKNIDGAAADQIIDSMRYDELSQLRTKNLGKDPATGVALDSLIYDYNIRGWVTGINKNYVGGTTNHYFGMELGYDNLTSVATGTSYSPLYNGNIAGTVWKSLSDGVNRKYDFTYDNSSRLLGAAYSDNLNGGSWGATKMDFSSNGLSYDANGNIMAMTQKGFKVGSPTGAIDQLTYTYQVGSNKLLSVADGANDSASTLGDFHYKLSTKGSTDYAYDGNGNLTLDANKGLTGILYNYMNLPVLVAKGVSGIVTYAYDATGNKIWKQVTTYTPTYQWTTTLYLGGLQYVQKVAPYIGLNGLDSLQFVGTEEGRARWAYHKHLAGDTAYGYEYDFAEKDHLGDERVMLSQEKDTAQYMCTMEPQYRATENALFYNVDSVSYAAASVTGISGGFPAPPNGPVINDSVIKLDGNGPKMGPAIILKVMAGDRITMGTYYYYNPIPSTPTSPLTAQNLVSSLVSGLATLSPIASEGTTILSGPSSSAIQAALTSVTSNDTGSLTSRPQAYLNWVSLDNQFNPVTGSLQNGALQVKTAGPNGTGLQSPLGQTITVLKSGYLYIYLSNISKGWPVFFDNLSILHYNSPLIEENHYYPFGLTMAGISDKAIKTQYAENKYRYNKGSELQNKEFADGSGLEVYETQLRTLDPQLGRWWQPDPKTDQSYESVSPYSAMNNDPDRYNDPNGDEGEACCEVLQKIWDNTVKGANYVGYLIKEGVSTAGDNFNKRWEAGVTLPQEFVKNPLSAVTGVGGPAGIVVEGLEASAAKAVGEVPQVTKNAAQGKAWETQVTKDLATEGHDKIAEQVMIKPNGVKTGNVRLDNVSMKDGKIALTDAKSSATAPLTKNQKPGYPAIEKNGGVVVGDKGASQGYPAGTVIPPTKVDIRRP